METYTFEKVWQTINELAVQHKETEKVLSEKFLETDKKFQETDKKFQETERLLKEKSMDSEKRWKEIQEELGGIGKSNGAIAEDFFYSALEKSMSVAKLNFDYIDRNFNRKRNQIQAEYDIILYNDYKVLIVEVKYNFKKKYLLEFYQSLKKFKSLFPEYKDYKLFGAIAAMTFEKEVLDEAKDFGFFILTQNNQDVKILNDNDFEPNVIK